MQNFVSVDGRFRAEGLFQIYWLFVNFSMAAFIEISFIYQVNLSEGAPWLDGKSLGLKNHTLITCAILASGLTSALLFLVRYDKEELERLGAYSAELDLWDKAYKDCKMIKKSFRPLRCFSGCINFALSLWDYFLTLTLGHNYLSSGHTIWGVVTLAIPFLPGIEWHSMKGLKGGSHRLTWFLSSLFFPVTVVASRVSYSFFHYLMPLFSFWRSLCIVLD